MHSGRKGTFYPHLFLLSLHIRPSPSHFSYRFSSFLDGDPCMCMPPRGDMHSGRKGTFYPPSLPSLSPSVHLRLISLIDYPRFWTATHAYAYRRLWKICISQTDRIGQLTPLPLISSRPAHLLFYGGRSWTNPQPRHMHYRCNRPPTSEPQPTHT